MMRWKIYRQELVLFHPRHKRLRFFYELTDSLVHTGRGSSTHFDRYRRHIQQILTTLREVLKSFPVGAEITFDDSSAEFAGSGEVKLCPTAKSLPALRSYLKCCEEILNYEGQSVGENGVVSEPFAMIKALIRSLECYDLDHPVPITHIAPKTALMHLISCLPILPHWDMPGLFSHNSNRQESLLANIRYLSEPIYAAQISYKRSTAEKLSSNLLGYQVDLRVCFSESTSVRDGPIFTSEEDYYEYCHCPEIKDSDYSSYIAYGSLFDALQQPLVENYALGEESEEKKVFYVSYPINTSLGRTHFWHFYLVPEYPGATLEDLWSSWWPLHQQILGWGPLHASLAAEFEQLDIAYAQGEILKSIGESNADGSNSLDRQLDELVCGQGEMLFPAVCFCLEDKMWRYKRVLDNKIDLGHNWVWESREPKCNEEEYAHCSQVGRLKFLDIATHKKKSNSIGNKRKIDTKALGLNRRNTRLVEQQRYLVEQMVGAYRNRLDEEQRERDRARKELLEKLTNKAPWALEVLEYLDGDNWKDLELLESDESVSVSGTYVKTAGQIADLIFGGDAGNGSVKSRLKILLEGGLHQYLSSILELHPVKGLSHGGDHRAPDFAEEWGIGKIAYAADKAIANLEMLKETVGSELLHHLNLIVEGLTTLKGCEDQRCCEIPASKLSRLRQKYGGEGGKYCSVGDYFDTLTSAYHINAARLDEQVRFRSSIPLEILLPINIMRSLIDNVRTYARNGFTFKYLALPRSGGLGRDLRPWVPTVFRNYVALSYFSEGARITGTPSKYDIAVTHLRKYGGDIIVITKKGEVRTVSVFDQEEGLTDITNCDDPICEYRELFTGDEDMAIVLTFDGWYMQDAGNSS